jgi:hypothetical protein
MQAIGKASFISRRLLMISCVMGPIHERSASAGSVAIGCSAPVVSSMLVILRLAKSWLIWYPEVADLSGQLIRI